MIRCAALAAALALAGCASTPRPPVAAADADCLQRFAVRDAAVDAAGVRDAEADRIDGFAALRVDRFSAALAPRARRSDAALAAWVERLRVLDAAARDAERSNLGAPHDEALERCSHQLAASTIASPAAREALLANAQVPDRYSATARVAGLYALTRVPFFAGVQAWQREQEDAMRTSVAAPRPARRFAPVAPVAPAPTRYAPDVLGVPQIDAAAAERLLAAYAPLVDIEQRAGFDDFGALRWGPQARIEVDGLAPTVYQRLAFTLVDGQPLVQLVYTLWFPERPRDGAFDLLGGTLDGVILRLTLAPDGTPILLDTIHACGCFHLFFPADTLRLKPDAPTDEEWAFVPARLPALHAGERFVVRIASATHHVLGIGTAAAAGDAVRYALAPESSLRTLPRADGGTKSLYRPDGLVAGSERAERWFFWPMGIASAGAMRQWGHHATAFVGRRHFDDADLIDKRFALPSSARR